MMAKMFYTLDETKTALGRNEEEIKQLAREGRLREFRDGPRLMFKADQVEQLKGEIASGGGAGSGMIDLGPSDSGSPIGLADSRGASGIGISLSDTGGGTGAGMSLKDDTAMAGDIGLSASVGGMPSPTSPSGTGVDLRSGSGSGLNVLGVDDSHGADPSAQTAISSSMQDQVNLEAVGSGSGLLDLTRESDDTSLGAELLDEITPGGTAVGARRQGGGGASGDFGSMTLPGASDVAPTPVKSSAPAARAIATPVYVEAHDGMAPAFGAACLGAFVFMLFGFLALSGGMAGYRTDLVKTLAAYGFLVVSAIGLGVVVIFFLIGLIVGRVSGR